MPSLRDVKKRITAVKNIKQITYAMKMVASAKIKKAQTQILSLKPYVSSLEDIMATFKNEMAEEDYVSSNAYRFFSKDKLSNSIGIVVISPDKGLCGSYNNSIILKAIKLIKENNDKKIHLICVGKKAVDFFKKINGINIEYTMVSIFPKVSYSHAYILSDEIIKMYDKYNLEKVYCVYGEFKNILVQEIKASIFLPLVDFFSTKKLEKTSEFFIFEPDKKQVLDRLINKYINIEIYRFLLESQASELSARMNAMELANKNASELSEELVLKMNKLRQAQITTELAEIVGGANAVNQ